LTAAAAGGASENAAATAANRKSPTHLAGYRNICFCH
jgi:hypothetical protein